MSRRKCVGKGGAAFARQRVLKNEEYQNTLDALMQTARSEVLGTSDIAALDDLIPDKRQKVSIQIKEKYLALCQENGVQPR